MRELVLLQFYKVVVLQLSLGHLREGDDVSKLYESFNNFLYKEVLCLYKVFLKVKLNNKLKKIKSVCIHLCFLWQLF